MVKTIRVVRSSAEEDYSWALALNESSRIALATKLVEDLWHTAHNTPFPSMDRQTVSMFLNSQPVSEAK
jgi:hypothetical protein